jgi:hypothetical protein
LMDPIINCFNFLFNFFHALDSNLKIVNQGEFDAAQESVRVFLEEWQSEQAIALHKTLDFIKWRTSAPGSNYSYLLLREAGGKIIGVVILRHTTIKGIPCVAILDFMVLKAGVNYLSRMHKAIFYFAKMKGCSAVVAMCDLKSAFKLNFFSNFFIPSPAVFKLIIKRLEIGEDLAQKIKAEGCFFWLDSDDL